MSSVQGIIGVNIGNFKTYLPVDCNLFVKISLYWMLFYRKMHVDWSFWSFERERVCEVDTTYSFCTAVPLICCCIIYRVLVCEVMGRMCLECRKYKSMNSFTVRSVMFMHCWRMRYEQTEYCLLYFQTCSVITNDVSNYKKLLIRK